MKVFKKKDHSLLVKPFGIKDTLYLACTILIFFDLNDPEGPLTEQELWATIPGELGQDGILDIGMPKPRAEVLVRGKCFAPGGTLRPASEVSFKVGGLQKGLSVFGNRFWKRSGSVQVITDPEPFKEMSITWKNAFGGGEFDKNPVGKGIRPVLLSDGQTLIPLPNIEDPKGLIGSPSDRPDPAGIGPIDVMWPQRFRKQGTYDEKWQRERWPHFPDDMNFEFFNTAPEDQFIDGFFKGDESIEIMNMHRDIQVIQSRLPGLRIRCFVTKKKSLKAPPEEDEVFEEVKTHIDTVWLFPGILRGVVMYRGTTEILDEEYADVRRIFLSTEDMKEEPKPIEHYLEEQKKLLDRTVPMDPAPFEAARKNVGDAMKRINRIPKDIEGAKLRAMGKAPVMPRSPAEKQARAQAVLDDAGVLISKLEAQANDVHLKYGHLAKVDLERFDVLRKKIKKVEEGIAQATVKAQKAQQAGSQLIKDMSADLKKYVSPEQLAKAGIDPDSLIPPKAVHPWHDRGFPLVVQWRKNLERDRNVENTLRGLGFDRRTIRRAWFGINPNEIREERNLWSLEEKKDNQDGRKSLALPAGLVMPRFQDARLNRILIRPGDFNDSGMDVVVEGSDETPLFLPAVEPEGAPVVRVEDELGGWFLEQEIGDACSVIVLKEPDNKPDSKVSEAIKRALSFLIVVPAGYREREHHIWKAAYPNAKVLPLPAGKSLFEARKHGTDIRKWIMEALPEEFACRHRIEPVMPEPGKPPGQSPLEGFSIPAFDVKGISDSLKEGIREACQPKLEKVMALRGEMETEAREAISMAGKNPDEVLNATGMQQKMSLSETGHDLAKTVTGQMEQLRADGHLTEEMETRMKTGASQVSQLGEYGEKRYQEGMAKIEAGKKKLAEAKAKILAGELPKQAKEKLENAGLDPEKMKRLTREEVIERYEKGESLEGAILSGLDLSHLNLQGIDLTMAQCHETKFCESNLDGANLSQVLAQEADFTKASLKNIKSEKGIFSKAIFKEASLNGSDLHMAVLQEADLTRADCSGSKFHMTVLKKAKLNGTNFSEVRANMCVFSSADASDANFAGAHLTKCLFQKTRLDRADFSNAVIHSTMFQEAKGEEVKFTGADMTKARMGGKASFPKADFRNIKMAQGCFRDSDLSGALFQGSELEMSMFENCDLNGADFYRVPAKRTRFSKSNLEGTDMRGVNLFQGSLRKARLVNADLTGSNLYGVDFYKAVFGKTKIDGANLKMTQLYNRTEYLP
ncbi:MAG: DUF2169 domain-containing protein [Pseudomonadota bacterium]